MAEQTPTSTKALLLDALNNLEAASGRDISRARILRQCLQKVNALAAELGALSTALASLLDGTDPSSGEPLGAEPKRAGRPPLTEEQKAAQSAKMKAYWARRKKNEAIGAGMSPLDGEGRPSND